MESFLTFLQQLEAFFAQAATAFVGIINYVLFIGAIVLLATMVITDRRGDNIGFNAGRWALIAFVAAIGITVAKEAFNIA